MLRNIRSLGMLMVMMMALACSKELSVDHTGGKGGNNNQTASFRMKINGAQWQADQAAAATMLLGVTELDGLSKTNKLLVITLFDTVAGTYKLSPTSLDYAMLLDSADANGGPYATNAGDSTQSGGTVVVTSVDKTKKTLSGTFQFKLFRSTDKKQLTITEGVFENLPYSSSLPPGNPTDTLKAKVGNTNWTAEVVNGILNGSKDTVTVLGSDASVTQAISLSFPTSLAPGTYAFGTHGIIGSYLSGGTNAYVSISGSLTILATDPVNKKVRGNFNFIGADYATGTQTVQITQGYFSLAYQ